MYVATVHGAPQKPSSATWRGSSARTLAIVSSTGANAFISKSVASLSRAVAEMIAGDKRGPSPASNVNFCPSAWGTTRISENRIAASKPNRRTGCSVTSASSTGLKHKSRNDPAFARTSRYSGRYRPACRMSQIGVCATLLLASTSNIPQYACERLIFDCVLFNRILRLVLLFDWQWIWLTNRSSGSVRRLSTSTLAFEALSSIAGYEGNLLEPQWVIRSDRSSFWFTRVYFNGARTGRFPVARSCGYVEIR